MVCLYNVEICDVLKLVSICKFILIIGKIVDFFIVCWFIEFISVVILRGCLIVNER